MTVLAPATRLVRVDSGAAVAVGAAAGIDVWALDADLKVVPVSVATVARCTARVSEVRLSSGRVAAVAEGDCLLTRDGWQPVADLRIGARIAVPRVVPDPAAAAWWPDDEVVLLAHLLSDVAAIARPPPLLRDGGGSQRRRG